LSVGCGIGLQEAELSTPELLIVDLRFSIARPSLIFNRKSPVEIAENIGREYSSAFQRRWGATRSK
jgi:hypothetical protein